MFMNLTLVRQLLKVSSIPNFIKIVKKVQSLILRSRQTDTVFRGGVQFCFVKNAQKRLFSGTVSYKTVQFSNT